MAECVDLENEKMASLSPLSCLRAVRLCNAHHPHTAPHKAAPQASTPPKLPWVQSALSFSPATAAAANTFLLGPGSWHPSSYQLPGLLLRTNGGTRAPYSWLRDGLHPAFTTHSTLGGTGTWMPLTAGVLEGAFICTWLRVSKLESRCLVSFEFYGVIVNARIWGRGARRIKRTPQKSYYSLAHFCSCHRWHGKFGALSYPRGKVLACFQSRTSLSLHHRMQTTAHKPSPVFEQASA